MTPFFKNFPSTSYENDEGRKINVTNILTAFSLKYQNINSFMFFQRYVISDGETPLSIARDLYGDESLHWTILVVNSIVNPYYDFQMSSNIVEQFTDSKYEDGRNGIHHFYDVVLDRECDDYDTERYRADIELVPEHVRVVTNYEYEIEQNGEKREILVINPVLINQFVELVHEALKQK